MKNACIVLRNNRIPLNGQEFEGGISALLQGGYAADKVYILSQSDPHEFMQTAVECKNFFDNVLVFCEESSLAGVRAKVCEILKVEPSAASVIRADSKAFFCLPFGETGAGIVKAEVLPFLDEKYSVRHAQSVIRAVGVPAERKRTLLAQLRNMAGISVFDSERDGDLRLEILYNDDSPKMAVDEAVRLAAESLNDYTYAVDDTPLNRRIYEMLKLRGMKLSVAESFTGGGVAKKLIEVPGVSEVLFERHAPTQRSRVRRYRLRNGGGAYRHGQLFRIPGYDGHRGACFRQHEQARGAVLHRRRNAQNGVRLQIYFQGRPRGYHPPSHQPGAVFAVQADQIAKGRISIITVKNFGEVLWITKK